MSTAVSSLETGHEDMIHDAQFDYYGKRLATASSDRSVRIFDIVGDTQEFVAALPGHEGPVFQVAWAHPKFGSVLATCSYDRKVIIWKEERVREWTPFYEYNGHESSVNSIDWAPHEHGLVLVCGSSDGKISVLSKPQDGDWAAEVFHAHSVGVNAVSWAPAVAAGSLLAAGTSSPGMPVKRFVSGGCDNMVRVWRQSPTTGKWEQEHELPHHSDWVRDVAWAPSIGLPSSTLASCSQDRQVVIWTKDDQAPMWKPTVLKPFPDVVWRLSWSVTGNVLAVSSGDNKVTLWKETLDGEWACLSSMNEDGSADALAS